MESNLENEINQLINKAINSKKTLFGKSFSEVGTSDSNLILRTKGDIKIQWGGKFIDLLKNGKINTLSELIVKKVDSENDITSTKGIYITKDNKIYVGNKSENFLVNSDTSSFISFTEDLALSLENLNTVLKNIGIVFDSEESLLNSEIQEGFVYLKSTKIPYIYRDGVLTSLLYTPTQVTSFDELQVNKIISENTIEMPSVSIELLESEEAEIENLSVKNLNVSNIIYNDISKTESVISSFIIDTLGIGLEINFRTSIESDVKGTIISYDDKFLTVQNQNEIYKYLIVYLKSKSDDTAPIEPDLICIGYSDSLNKASFNINQLNCDIQNSNILIPYVLNDTEFEYDIYEDLECLVPIKTNIFNPTGKIYNSTIISTLSNYATELNLQNCHCNGNLILTASDETPEEILNILSNSEFKNIYLEDNSFHILKNLPKNSIILCSNPDVPISDIKISTTLPSLQVKNSSGQIIGSTENTLIEIPLTLILINSNLYSWQLI